MSVRQGNNIIAIGNVAVDGDTVGFNGNASLEARGVMNKNTAAGATDKLYDWVGTTAEYTAQDVATNHPDWLCFITDDDASELLDTSWASELGMPSAYRESVTLLASGSEYTAPANGWWYFTGQLGAGSGTSNQILMYARDFIEGNNLTARVLAPNVMASYPAILPARAGSKLVLSYASTSATPNWLFFFHYAVGEGQ